MIRKNTQARQALQLSGWKASLLPPRSDGRQADSYHYSTWRSPRMASGVAERKEDHSGRQGTSGDLADPAIRKQFDRRSLVAMDTGEGNRSALTVRGKPIGVTSAPQPITSAGGAKSGIVLDLLSQLLS